MLLLTSLPGPLSSSNWLADVRSTLEDRMAACQTKQYEFAILALAQDPLPSALQALDNVTQSIATLTSRMSGLDADLSTGPGAAAEEEVLRLHSNASVSEADRVAREESLAKVLASESLSEMLTYFRALNQAQQTLEAQVAVQQQSEADDAEKARSRRFDYEPAIRFWIACLARTRRLKDLLDWADQGA